MDHDTRAALALSLAMRLAETYPGEILVVGVYGSTARGTDTPWSDVDMYAVVRDGCAARSRGFIVDGIAVGIDVQHQTELETLLREPALAWPFRMGVLHVLRVLAGDPGLVEVWMAMGHAVPRERFRRAVSEAMGEQVLESYGRVHSCALRGNENDIWIAALEVINEIATILCLLNQRWVTHDYYDGIVETFDFPLLPNGYREIIPALWHARGTTTIVPLTERLYTAFRRLLAREGIAVPEYRRVEDLPL